MVQSKYFVYEKFRKFLGRKNVENSGSVATLLLDIFVYGDRQMRAEHIYEKGLCEKKGGENFSAWRASLIAKKIIIHEPDSVFYHPGSAIIPYINEEKAACFEMASMNDLDRLKKQMYDAIQKISEDNPPVTTEKLDKHLQLIGI